MSMCRVVSCVVGGGCLLWLVHFLGKTPVAFALLHFVLQGQICLLLQLSLDFLLLYSSPLWWNEHLFLALVLEGLVRLHRLFNFNFFSISVWSTDLDYCDTEYFALETEFILSFLRLQPSTAFWTLLLTMRATAFLIRDYCPL